MESAGGEGVKGTWHLASSIWKKKISNPECRMPNAECKSGEFQMTIDELINRRIPQAVVAALVLQAGTVVWWAATRDSDIHFQQQHIDQLEQTVSQTKDAQEKILERLAQIEERVNDELFLLERMGKQRGASKK
jgi:hypothetical protein